MLDILIEAFHLFALISAIMLGLTLPLIGVWWVGQKLAMLE